jgi:hypothetical protein
MIGILGQEQCFFDPLFGRHKFYPIEQILIIAAGLP